jgi:hypothetical protein
MYAGQIGSIQVGLWADTAEISNIEAISTGGNFPYETPVESPLPESEPTVFWPYAVAIAAAILITMTILVVKKQSNCSHSFSFLCSYCR